MKPLLVLLAAFNVSCASTPYVLAPLASTPFVGRYSTQAAEREAWRDIAAGHMKIYLAGGIGVYEVGVADEDRHLIKTLPRDNSLPVGCTDPQASEAADYARAYNQAIVRYLRSHPKN